MNKIKGLLKNKKFVTIGLISLLIIVALSSTFVYLKYFSYQGNKKDLTTNQVQVVTKYINIRSKASLDGKILGEVSKGEYYNIIDTIETTKYTWYKIKTNRGIVGYIANPKEEKYLLVNSINNDTNTSDIDEDKEEIETPSSSNTIDNIKKETPSSSNTNNNNSNNENIITPNQITSKCTANFISFPDGNTLYSELVNINEFVKRPNAIPEKDGYKFIDWFIGSTPAKFDFSDNYALCSSNRINTPIYITARWENLGASIKPVNTTTQNEAIAAMRIIAPKYGYELSSTIRLEKHMFKIDIDGKEYKYSAVINFPNSFEIYAGEVIRPGPQGFPYDTINNSFCAFGPDPYNCNDYIDFHVSSYDWISQKYPHYSSVRLSTLEDIKILYYELGKLGYSFEHLRR